MTIYTKKNHGALSPNSCMAIKDFYGGKLFRSLECSKESRATLACLYRTLGQVYMLQLRSVDSRHLKMRLDDFLLLVRE